MRQVQEDLACFNDELLARVIATSELPVISAIGHETDFTIADFVSDLRAPTPSAAAELVTAAEHLIEDRVAALTARVQRVGRFRLMHARQRYTRLSADFVLTRLRDTVNRRDQHLDELRFHLDGSARRHLRLAVQRFVSLFDRLHRQNMAIRIATTHRRLQSAAQRLHHIMVYIVNVRQSRLNRASARLESLSPFAVMSRGYALVYNSDGTLLRSAVDTAIGQTVRARLARGTLVAEVTQTTIEEVDVTEANNA